MMEKHRTHGAFRLHSFDGSQPRRLSPVTDGRFRRPVVSTPSVPAACWMNNYVLVINIDQTGHPEMRHDRHIL